MKKMFQILFALALLSLALQYIITNFITEDKDQYTLIASDNHEYLIVENYNKQKNGKHIYSFKLKDHNNNTFVFDYTNEFNVRTRIITDIKRYEKDGVVCLFPIYLKEYSDDIICNYNGENYSYTSLKQRGMDVDSFVNSLQQESYTNLGWNPTLEKDDIYNMSVYRSFPEEFTLALWSYKGIYDIEKDKIEEKIYFGKNRYYNKLSALAGKFYVTANTEEEKEFSSFYAINIKEGGKKTLSSMEISSFSYNSYINGSVNDKVYLTDKDAKVQYEISPNKGTINVVGNHELGGKYYDGEKWQTVNFDELLNQEYLFRETVDVERISSKYPNAEIRKSNQNYYFKTPDNRVYKVVKENFDYPILLFQLPEFEDWKVIDDTLFGITGNIIYMYDHKYGLKPLIKYDELLNNSYNMFEVYKLD